MKNIVFIVHTKQHTKMQKKKKIINKTLTRKTMRAKASNKNCYHNEMMTEKKKIKIKDKQTIVVGSRNRTALNHKNLSYCGNWNFHLNRIQYALIIIAIHKRRTIIIMLHLVSACVWLRPLHWTFISFYLDKNTTTNGKEWRHR